MAIKYKYWKQTRDLKKGGEQAYQISMFEQQNKMLHYNGEDQAQDYVDVLNCLALVALFGVVAPFPLTLLALIAVSLHFRARAVRLLTLYQRVHPKRAACIGIWNPILKFLNVACIVNVTGLWAMRFSNTFVHFIFAHTPHYLTFMNQESRKDLDDVAFWVVWAGTCAVGLIFMVCADLCINNTCGTTALNKRRQRHQREVLFEEDPRAAEFFTAQKNIQLQGTTDLNASRTDNLGSFHNIEQLKQSDRCWSAPIGFV
jgi:hypothetical protein